jgi:hypothetical protein
MDLEEEILIKKRSPIVGFGEAADIGEYADNDDEEEESSGLSRAIRRKNKYLRSEDLIIRKNYLKIYSIGDRRLQ